MAYEIMRSEFESFGSFSREYAANPSSAKKSGNHYIASATCAFVKTEDQKRQINCSSETVVAAGQSGPRARPPLRLSLAR